MQNICRPVSGTSRCMSAYFNISPVVRSRTSRAALSRATYRRRLAAAASVTTPEADLVEVELKIEGLMCESCDSRVQNALNGMEGVKDVRVSHESGMATIQVNAPSLLDAWNQVPKLVEAVDSLGFKAEPYLDG